MTDKKILERYLSSNGSLQDRGTIMEWFSSISDESSLRKLSFPFWENPDVPSHLSEDEAGRLLDRIHHLIRLQEQPVRRNNDTAIRYLKILSRVAAILFIPLVLFLWTIRDQIFSSGGEEIYSEIHCPPGTRTMFHLPDGTRGWLNGGSSIEFPAEFSGKEREVQLKGEAYFDVESSPRNPFIVSGDHIKVKAYGTSFNIMSYTEEKKIEVTLVEGNVDIIKGEPEKEQKLGSLVPGQMLIFNPGSSARSIIPADIEKSTSWKDGKLIFRDDSFIDIVRKCNRWYNVNIEIKDKALGSYTYVGTFQDETLDEVLRLFTMTAPIEYIDKGRLRKEDGTFEKRQIELYFKR